VLHLRSSVRGPSGTVLRASLQRLSASSVEDDPVNCGRRRRTCRQPGSHPRRRREQALARDRTGNAPPACNNHRVHAGTPTKRSFVCRVVHTIDRPLMTLTGAWNLRDNLARHGRRNPRCLLAPRGLSRKLRRLTRRKRPRLFVSVPRLDDKGFLRHILHPKHIRTSVGPPAAAERKANHHEQRGRTSPSSHDSHSLILGGKRSVAANTSR